MEMNSMAHLKIRAPQKYFCGTFFFGILWTQLCGAYCYMRHGMHISVAHVDMRHRNTQLCGAYRYMRHISVVHIAENFLGFFAPHALHPLLRGSPFLAL
jgi:hypothetical protein